ncbi:MAG: hypothetical protein V4631_20565 [Pseudomonadota bacterium]
MATSDKVFGQRNERPASFIFADGAHIAAREYGFYSINNFVLAPADELFNTCFKSDDLGAKFPVTAMAVRLAPIPHLYFLVFHTAIYLAYAKEILGADESTMAEIMVGIQKGVDDIRTPGGKPLGSAVKPSLISAAVSFSTAMIEDLRAARAAGAAAVQQPASQATKLLLGLVERSFHEANVENPPLLHGIGSEHAQRLQLLNDRPARVFNALQTNLQVRLMAPQ